MSVVPIDRGFRLACNRDEQRSRALADLPRRYAAGPRRAIYPVDPQGGGTWIGVNDAGLAATLLNHHPPGADGRGLVPAITRGRIVLRVLETASLDAALDLVAQLPLSDFRPFRLVIALEGSVGVCTSDGRTLVSERLALAGPLMWTSSSLGDELVQRPRRQLFDGMMNGVSATDWVAAQDGFHRHQWPDRPHVSVRMARSDALTVSSAVVEVGPEAVALVYRNCSGGLEGSDCGALSPNERVKMTIGRMRNATQSSIGRPPAC